MSRAGANVKTAPTLLGVAAILFPLRPNLSLHHRRADHAVQGDRRCQLPHQPHRLHAHRLVGMKLTRLRQRFRTLVHVARGSASGAPHGQPSRGETASQGQEGQTMTTTVLVADDDPDIRESVRDILEAEA